METGCNTRDKCLFPHSKVDNNQTKRRKKGWSAWLTSEAKRASPQVSSDASASQEGARHGRPCNRISLCTPWQSLTLSIFRWPGECSCRQIHLTRHFSHAVCTIHFMHITLHGSSVCMRASFHLHVIHD